MDRQLHAAEIHQESAAAASSALSGVGGAATIHIGDFFDVPFPAGSYQAVIGNPPYIRYQDWNGAARAKAKEAALAAGRPLTSLASSWAAFTIRSGELTAPEGRLGLVLPAELLTVNYAGPVRAYLMDRFARVRLVLFEQRVFPGVMEEVVLLLAEGNGPTDHIGVCQVQSAEHLNDLVSVRWQPPSNEGKWTPALLEAATAQIYADLLTNNSIEVLEDWGRTDLGMVSGNNNYFAMSVEKARQLGLDERSLLRISPPGSRHLRGLTFSEAAWKEMARKGARGYLFYPEDDPRPAALDYIDQGTKAGVHRAYKCRARTPWWRVPLTGPADLFLTYMNHDTPRLTTNRAGVHHLNSVHGVTLGSGRQRIGRDLLPIASLNSVTLLGAELVGRSYGGGILKVEPKEADLLPVPSLQVVQAASPDLRALRPQLGIALRNGHLDEAVEMVDRIIRRHTDLTHNDLTHLRTSRKALFDRRIARSNGAR
jgi:adenine-specific DNA methylase